MSTECWIRNAAGACADRCSPFIRSHSRRMRRVDRHLHVRIRVSNADGNLEAQDSVRSNTRFNNHALHDTNPSNQFFDPPRTPQVFKKTIAGGVVQFSQSSIRKPGTREKSRALAVRSKASRDNAIDAIFRSCVPIRIRSRRNSWNCCTDAASNKAIFQL
jgi:hypothetical protein